MVVGSGYLGGVVIMGGRGVEEDVSGRMASIRKGEFRRLAPGAYDGDEATAPGNRSGGPRFSSASTVIQVDQRDFASFLSGLLGQTRRAERPQDISWHHILASIRDAATIRFRFMQGAIEHGMCGHSLLDHQRRGRMEASTGHHVASGPEESLANRCASADGKA